ncbi:MAG TPA: diaminopimelate epimerase [Bacteroidales bacterium]|nr:diaminopimelate epimerase [Bacteroidales bacterium]
MDNFFVKAHGLGNEYIVFDQKDIHFELSKPAIQRLCNINFGIGSDGILLKVPSTKADFGFRVFNPDGSEAEKSGNGLRIFCKFIYDYGYTPNKNFTVETKGGIVKATIEKTDDHNKAQQITVDMGIPTFKTKEIPAIFPSEEIIAEKMGFGGKEYEINCVSMGNPHCTILRDTLNINEIKSVGSIIENHTMFPNRINVQFAKIINRNEVEVLIWERGAGFTLASGSSSCAVASVLYKRGLIDNKVTIKMLGGELTIAIQNDWNIRMTGPVRQICQGTLSQELIEDLNNSISNK